MATRRFRGGAGLPLAGGGGARRSNTFHQATRTLTNTEIKALPTTHYEIIPAPGENKLILLEYAMLVTNWSAANKYTNITLADPQFLAFYYGEEEIDATDLGINASILGGDDPLWARFPCSTVVSGNGTRLTSIEEGVQFSANKSINLYCYNGGIPPGDGPFTGGDDSNVLVVTIPYLVLDITTGRFE